MTTTPPQTTTEAAPAPAPRRQGMRHHLGELAAALHSRDYLRQGVDVYALATDPVVREPLAAMTREAGDAAVESWRWMVDFDQAMDDSHRLHRLLAELCRLREGEPGPEATLARRLLATDAAAAEQLHTWNAALEQRERQQ